MAKELDVTRRRRSCQLLNKERAVFKGILCRFLKHEVSPAESQIQECSPLYVTLLEGLSWPKCKKSEDIYTLNEGCITIHVIANLTLEI